MAQATHTPGPWRIHAQYDNDPRLNGKRSLIRQHNEDGSTDVIASNIRGTETARLIAAAPELLAALDALLTATDGDIYTDAPEYDGRLQAVFMALSQARAAITKAKGEDHAAD